MLPSSRGARGRGVGLALTLASLLALAAASEADHKYKAEEPVKLWVNKVGPYNNSQETYNYYNLPFCQPSENPIHKWGGLGEVLGGNELIDSQLDIKLLRNEKGFICTLELDAKKVRQFADAIENSYWFELFIDDLPLWGFVGETDKNSENKHYLYTHKNILVKYNENRIIHVNLTQESPKLLEAGKKLDMTYSVKWVATDVSFARRFEVYLDYPFFEHQILWFSIFNSFMMVIFLTGLVSMIFTAKYAREDDDLESLERDVNEESGWKLVHGDVFRPPRSLMFLSALVGIGTSFTRTGTEKQKQRATTTKPTTSGTGSEGEPTLSDLPRTTSPDPRESGGQGRMKAAKKLSVGAVAKRRHGSTALFVAVDYAFLLAFAGFLAYLVVSRILPSVASSA